MKVFLYFFALFGIALARVENPTTYDFFQPNESLGTQEYHDHRGLKVYFFTPLYNSNVEKVVVGNQGVWTKKPGQTLTKVVGFFRCMGFGLSHVSYFTDEGETKELLLGYSHGDDDLVVVDKEKFYTKLVDYTNTADKYNPNVPGHPVLHQLEYLLKEGVRDGENTAQKVKEVLERAKAKREEAERAKPPHVEVPSPEVPLKEEVHAEL